MFIFVLTYPPGIWPVHFQSLGRRMRLTLAVSMLKHADLVLLDEPTPGTWPLPNSHSSVWTARIVANCYMALNKGANNFWKHRFETSSEVISGFLRQIWKRQGHTLFLVMLQPGIIWMRNQFDGSAQRPQQSREKACIRGFTWCWPRLCSWWLQGLNL